jgi:hypothetical protein
MPGAYRTRKRCDDCRKAVVTRRNAASTAKRLEQRQAKRMKTRDPYRWYSGCEHCRKSFQATRADQRFCSNACRQAEHRSRTKKARP